MTDLPKRDAGSPPDDADLSVDLEWTTRILTDFIAESLGRTGLERLVVGLSGGIDSAVSTYLAARAIGPERVHAVLMPFRSSSPASRADAEAVVADLGLPSEVIDISPMVDGFVAVSGETVDRLRLGNVMARVRMVLLYDRSARDRALVLGTSNKTEMLLGYSTLHGDSASAINPIGDLYKTQVRALATHLGVPEAIVRKPPSADLWPDQSDEDELGFSYEALDRALALLVDARVSPETAIELGCDAALVERARRLIVRSQFKRRPPVLAKVSTRSVGWDFLYPRDWMT